LESPAPEVPSQKTTHFDTFFDEANANGNGGGFLIEEIEHEEGGGFMREEDANGGGGGFFAAEDQDRGSVSEKHHGQSNTGLDAALGVRSMSETALVEEGGESVTQTLPMTAPTCEPPNVAPSPPDTVAESHGGFVLDRREEPPALVKQSSTLSVKDLGSTRSPDSIENQSLLSHDPEDEDAEPEWLVDDAEL
jgi:xeroderma pigmentosum group C-complementing protein